MFLDTSVIIDIFRFGPEDDRFRPIYEHIGDEPLYMSVIQVGEISDVCLRSGVDPGGTLSLIREFVNVVPLSEELCLEGSAIEHEMRRKGNDRFSLVDGLILASARSVGQRLLTGDGDFEGVEDAVV
jgi:predicted nucleic acid-binding protein